jgi:hypothetical protein
MVSSKLNEPDPFKFKKAAFCGFFFARARILTFAWLSPAMIHPGRHQQIWKGWSWQLS